MEAPKPATDRGDTFTRDIEHIKARIGARFVGEKAAGQPVLRPDGRRFLESDLDKRIGPLNITQADIDRAFEGAVRESGPAATEAIRRLSEEGKTLTPPPESHWKAIEDRALRDRLWYEISAEAMEITFPDHRGTLLERVMDIIAATSPLADPNYNAELAVSIISEMARGIPSTTPAVVQKSVRDAITGEFGKQDARKIGSFGGTFRFLAGLTDEAPLSTNDRQVAASFGVPDNAFGRFPVIYEAVSRFFSNLRDHVNASRTNDPEGPFQTWQLQAPSWVQTRAEQRQARRTEISEEDAFQGDAYPSILHGFELVVDRICPCMMPDVIGSVAGDRPSRPPELIMTPNCQERRQHGIHEYPDHEKTYADSSRIVPKLIATVPQVAQSGLEPLPLGFPVGVEMAGMPRRMSNEVSNYRCVGRAGVFCDSCLPRGSWH